MKIITQTVALLGALFLTNVAIAATDMSAQAKFLEAKVNNHQQGGNHAGHIEPIQFYGVFYGFTPCKNCNGIKTTLSLKSNDNYLLVTQPAKESSREFFEKGKYSWDEENKLVLLTPRDNQATTRLFRIKDEGTLIQLNDDGTDYKGDEAERYTLRRSDTVQTREVHIH